MYKEILRGIAGIGICPVVSLLLFVAVFAVVVFRVIRMDRGQARRLAGLPLDETIDDGAARQEGYR
jgi:hypothetical protein